MASTGSVGTVSGIASGIQWQSMIDQIMQIESQPVTLLQNKISTTQSESDAWSKFSSLLTSLQSAERPLADGTAFKGYNVSVTGAPSGTTPLSVTAADTALPGTHSVTVLSAAAAETVGGADFSSHTAALGISGEFLVGGAHIQVTSSDSLDSIVSRINAADTGSSASHVTASVLSTSANGYRLVLTADQTGASGVDLVDGAAGALRQLGLLASTTHIKHATSSGANSDVLSSSTDAVATARGFTTAPAAGTITLGSGTSQVSVGIDLSTDSLDTIASKINAAASGVSGVKATVVDATAPDGSTGRQLQISGTTTFGDQNRILESLGVLAGDRSAVAQTVQGAALTAGDATTPASATTALTSLWSGGAAANVQAGDTLSIKGTRGDGSAFNMTYTVTGTDTLQDVLNALNGAAGFGGGSRTATASISSDGRVTVTDGTAGSSQLALSIVANNEGGGSLDLGGFNTTQTGRAREMVQGSDASLDVDGTYITNSSNTITNAVQGLTFNVVSAAPTSPLTVSVSQDAASTTSKVKALVGAYNAMVDFVDKQTTYVKGQTPPPLAGDSVLRTMKQTLYDAMETTLPASVGGSYTRLTDVGVEIDKTGHFTFDSTKLTSALSADPSAVARLFGDYGTTTDAQASYIGAQDGTRVGTYALNVTQAATQATASSSGFSGTYVDDATPDTLTLTDNSSGRSYSVQLSNGMTTQQIVDALNTQLATPLPQVLTSDAVYSDAAASSPATGSTLLTSLHHADGSSAGLADGSVITFSGNRANGDAYFGTYTVTASSTLDDLRVAMESQLGGDATVAIDASGQLTVTAANTGISQLSMAVSSDTGAPFGVIATTQQGRPASGITATNNGGQVQLTSSAYGSTGGFTISYSAGGSDGTASLGLAAGTYSGLDVQGTIGGAAATGSGQTLTADSGTPAAGLAIRWTGGTGSAGDVTYSRGVASTLAQQLSTMLGTGSGSITAITDQLGQSISDMNDQITTMQERLSQQRASLVRQYTAMEQAVAKAQTQGQWLTSQINQLAGFSASAGSSSTSTG